MKASREDQVEEIRTEIEELSDKEQSDSYVNPPICEIRGASRQMEQGETGEKRLTDKQKEVKVGVDW